MQNSRQPKQLKLDFIAVTQKKDDDSLTPFQKPEHNSKDCQTSDQATSSSSTSKLIQDFPDQPFHPTSTERIPTQVLKNRSLKFQTSWFEKFKWLHFCTDETKILCYYCSKAIKRRLITDSTKREPAFVEKGFFNWKKAIDRFTAHENSDLHKHCILKLSYENNISIDAQLSEQVNESQENARSFLRVLITSLMYLARQGLSIQGHNKTDGNLMELLRLRILDNPKLSPWLEKSVSYTHPDIQNEILQLISYKIVKKLTTDIQEAEYFSVIVDGTQDASGDEQQSICFRFIDLDFEPQEYFIGFYKVLSTTGLEIANMIEDVILRCGLDPNKMRGMSFDGAANMSGKLRGAQAILRKKFPTAHFFHCGAHCVNLALKDACVHKSGIKNALNIVNELGCLFSDSFKFRTAFSGVANSTSTKKLRPLCPTRWTYREKAVKGVIQQYDSILACLTESSCTTSDISSRCSGLFIRLSNASTYINLKLAIDIISPLTILNKKLQSSNFTVSQMIAATDECQKYLEGLKQSSLETVKTACEEADAKSLTFKSQRKSEGGDSTAIDTFSSDYTQTITSATAALETRFIT